MAEDGNKESTEALLGKLKAMLDLPWVRKALEIDERVTKLGLDLDSYKTMMGAMAILWRQAKDKETLRVLLADCVNLAFEIGSESEKTSFEIPLKVTP